jgi:hypothetical protein
MIVLAEVNGQRMWIDKGACLQSNNVMQYTVKDTVTVQVQTQSAKDIVSGEETERWREAEAARGRQRLRQRQRQRQR